MHKEGGWCASGGSWVTPEESMKVVVCNAQSVRGAQAGAIQLNRLYRNLGYYRDVAVFAVPDAEPALEPRLASIGMSEASLRALATFRATTGRVFRIFRKDSPLLPSGLLGPVCLRPVKSVEIGS